MRAILAKSQTFGEELDVTLRSEVSRAAAHYTGPGNRKFLARGRLENERRTRRKSKIDESGAGGAGGLDRSEQTEEPRCFTNVSEANLLREQRERKKEKQRTIMRFLRLADDNLRLVAPGRTVDVPNGHVSPANDKETTRIVENESRSARIGVEEEDDSRGWKVEEDKCQSATRLRSSPSEGNKEASKQQARPERSFNQPPRAQWHS
ncbi:hypothetical protein HZH68_012256 [Vespula germanica]|uniref:Uncharacterized protein n=1 Tax=Vespula germanica TaxID=30212 RepID=A0A834JHA0_VESGE|nr:hypothetical protein HZH68_012256 [Vespula germanica]